MTKKNFVFAYYPGCAAKQVQKEADWSARAICKELGIELHEMHDATCCGAGNLQETDPAAALAINARIFSQAEEMGMDIVTICNTCLQTFRYAYTRLQDDDIREKINTVLKKAGVKPFENKMEPKHLTWVLVEEFGAENLKKFIKNPLNGLKVAPFYGCHSLRPSTIFDHRGGERPGYLDVLIEAAGGEVLNYNGKDKCCGFHYMLPKEEYFLNMAGGHTLEAKTKGADIMTSPCTLCDMALGAYQGLSEKKMGTKIDLPEMSIQQLIGVSMGISGKELGLHKLHQNPEKTFKEHNVAV